MTIDRTTLHGTLLDATRVAARGGDLDTKLTALASHVPALSGATVAVVYLYDGETGTLLPSAGHGVGAEQLEQATLTLEDPEDPIAQVVLERRSSLLEIAASTGFAGLAAARPGLTAVQMFSLVVRDESGSDETQGALACGFEGTTRPDAAELAALGAIADLAAIVVRLARLEYAVAERADWYDRVAHTDALTGLANRRTFERMLELELVRVGRQATPLSLILFDIDGFRALTERKGGRVGDDVLRRVAATLAEQVRLVDTVARVGADEFAVIAPGAMGGLVARRVRDAVAALEPVEGTRISVCAGVVRFPDDGTGAEDLTSAAERVMQDAKREGPGSVVTTHEDDPSAGTGLLRDEG